MKTNILTSVSLLTFLLFSIISFSQDDIKESLPIQLTAKHSETSIILRWAPTTAAHWIKGMKHGYKISRRNLKDDGMKYMVLVDTLLPWTPDQINAYYSSHRDEEELAVVMKTMYQDWEDTYYQGGGFLEAVEKNEMLEQRYNMTLLASDLYKPVAEAAGLRWEDNTISTNELYAYKIELNGPVESIPAYYIAKQWNAMEKPLIFEAQEQDNSVKIRWDRTLHEKAYTAFYIEKSKDGSNYQRLNKKPFLNALTEGEGFTPFMVYTDYVDNYDQYYYRLIGIDPFGDESEPSEPVLAQGRDRTPPVVEVPIITSAEDDNHTDISWKHDPINEIRKAIIYKMDDSNDPRVVYESKGASFDFNVTDNDVIEGMTDYYLVLVDTAGNIGRSNKLNRYIPDNTPPKAPTNIRSKVDTSGTVTLDWDQGPDRDIIGYYLFSADRLSDNYIKLNDRKHIFTKYVDTLNTALLTEKRFYKIAAIDRAGNIGRYSEIIEVNRPDKIPPAPALFYNYNVDSVGIYLGLLKSSSIDVVKHNLYRRSGKSEKWDLLISFEKNVPQVYLDNNVKSNEYYSYRWVAEDEAGLESSYEQSELHLQAMDKRIYYRPILRLKRNKEGIAVEVAQDIPGEKYRIQIVRSLNNGKYKTLATLTNNNIYQDSSKGNSFSYKARILYKDGVRSKFGNESSITTN